MGLLERRQEGMHRRRFLALLGASAGTLLLPPPARADVQCGDWYQGMQECVVGIQSALLDTHVRQVGGQHASQWCWAACIETVFRYYGFPVSQERVVVDTWGGIVDMPADPNAILANLNRPWISDDGKAFQAYGDAYSANLETALQDLRDNAPLIVGTLGHAVVLTAIAYVHDQWGNFQIQNAIVRDPMPGSTPRGDGKRLLSAQEWYSIQFVARIRVEGLD